MRILLVAQTYLGSRNGPSVFTVRLAESLVGAGYEVWVATAARGPRGRRVRVGGVLVEELAALPLAPASGVSVTLREQPRLRRIAAEAKPDLVHVQDHFPLCAAGVRVARALAVPVVATNHFTPATMIRQSRVLRLWTRASERVLWRMVVRAFRGARVVTAPTRTAARLLEAEGLAPVRALSCGVDLARFRIPPSERLAARAEAGLASDLPVLLYVGRLDSDKGLDVLLGALGHAAHPVQLVVAGAGREERRLRALAARQPGRVVFTGFVPHERLPRLLAAADLFAMPSDIEVQSIATLEAMAAGLPVLAARGGALPELVTDGLTGRLFAPRDAVDAGRALDWLVEHGSRWAEMGEQGRLAAAAHDWPSVLQSYLELYAEVAGATAGHRDIETVPDASGIAAWRPPPADGGA